MLSEDSGSGTPDAQGCVWGTEEREYRYVCFDSFSRPLSNRECLDDGALFALLLGPLVACGLLHAAFSQLAAQVESPLPPGWKIELPLVLPNTPLRAPTLPATDVNRALSALATSRRNLVQLFTLLSFVLLVHLTRSLSLERTLSRNTTTPPSASMEREPSDYMRANVGIGTYWLKRGETRRDISAVMFSFVVTLGCIGVKILTAWIGRGVWSGELAAIHNDPA